MSDGLGTGGDLLVTVMREHGVDVAFGVVSVHNMPLVEAVDRDLRFVPVRHEAGAVSAADAYARVTGRLGVALTSTGTGSGNAAGSLIEAQSGGAGVLHVTGQISSRYLGQGRGVIHETRDQFGMLRAVSDHAATIRADAGACLRDAATRALSTPRGPVSVEWPIDLQYARQALFGPGSPVPGPLEPDPAQVAAAAELLAAARRPIIWAGGGARRAGDPLLTLAERLGAPVITSNAGRGTIPEDHPQVVGNFAASPAGRELLSEADLLLSIGTHFRSNETADYSIPVPARHVQIDIDVRAIGRVFPVDAGIAADAGRALTLLGQRLEEQAGMRLGVRSDGQVGERLGVRSDGQVGERLGAQSEGQVGERLGARSEGQVGERLGARSEGQVGGPAGSDGTEPSWRERGVEAALQARTALRAAIGPYAVICDALRTRFDRASVIARDVTIPSSQWGNRLLEIYDPATNLFPLGGGIGQGLAMGIGGAIARPGVPTLVIAGDGGLAVHLGELGTLAQERPWLVLVVFNDGGYGVLRNMQDAHSGRRSGVDLATPDFGLLASAYGLPYAQVTRAGDVAAALDKALAVRGPSLIEIDVSAIGPTPVPFVPPVEIPSA